MSRSKWLGWVCVIALAAGGAAVFHAITTGAIVVPERFNPWAPLSVEAEPNVLTRFKLDRAHGDRAMCQAALAGSGLRFEPVPDRDTGNGCGFENAVRLQAGHSVALGSPVVLSCRAALSFAMWERHGLQPAASKQLGGPVTSIRHLGSYACRNVNTGEGDTPGGRRSRHATADALDVAGFTLGGGRRIAVAQDWPKGASASGVPDAEALFLRDAHDSACRWFDGVLGPDYNAVHADHFHLETGGWHTCR